MEGKQMMLLAAAALSLGINVSAALGGSTPDPKPVCGISTVSYRFVGAPGTEFRYGRDSYRVPTSGTIELIAEKRISEYRVGERSLPLNVWPQDEFGTRTVPLPKRTASN
jgi:hypothetical protein